MCCGSPVLRPSFILLSEGLWDLSYEESLLQPLSLSSRIFVLVITDEVSGVPGNGVTGGHYSDLDQRCL